MQSYYHTAVRIKEREADEGQPCYFDTKSKKRVLLCFKRVVESVIVFLFGQEEVGKEKQKRETENEMERESFS